MSVAMGGSQDTHQLSHDRRMLEELCNLANSLCVSKLDQQIWINNNQLCCFNPSNSIRVKKKKKKRYSAQLEFTRFRFVMFWTWKPMTVGINTSLVESAIDWSSITIRKLANQTLLMTSWRWYTIWPVIGAFVKIKWQLLWWILKIPVRLFTMCISHKRQNNAPSNVAFMLCNQIEEIELNPLKMVFF